MQNRLTSSANAYTRESYEPNEGLMSNTHKAIAEKAKGTR